MKKLFLTLALLLSLTQVASAVVLDTVWVNPLRFPTYTCFFAAFSPDTNKIVAALDSTIYYLDIRTGAIIDSFQKAPEIIDYGAVMSSNGKRIAGVSGNYKCYVWDTTSKSIIKTFGGYNVQAATVALSPDGRYAVVGICESSGTDQFPKDTNKLLIYDLDADSIVKWIDHHTEGIAYIAYSPDGNSFVVSATYGFTKDQRGIGRLRKYTTNDWQVDTLLEDNAKEYYTYLSYSSDGRYLAGVKPRLEKTSYVWDMSADTIFKTYPSSVIGGFQNRTFFSYDNQYLLFSGADFNLGYSRGLIWDFINDTLVYDLNLGRIRSYLLKDNLILIETSDNIYLLSLDLHHSSVFEPTEKSDDISIAQENKTLIVKSKDFDLRKIEIYDVMGSLVMSKTADSEEIAVSMQSLKSGIYFVKVQTAKRVFVRKVLVVE
ncbi:MAG: T9SS type A sorting domain-containing protein [Bacteroidota bacterium]